MKAKERGSSPEPKEKLHSLGKMTLIYWKGEKFWVGKLLEHPEIMTQGRTLDELERNIKEAFFLMALDDVPAEYKVRELAMA